MESIEKKTTSRFEKRAEFIKQKADKWDDDFRKNKDQIKASMAVTFTRTSEHDDQVEIAEELRKRNYKVTSTPPEYDGMVKWSIEITESVKL